MGKGKKTKVQTMTYKTLHRNHRTGNTMGKGKKTKVQTMIYKTLHRNHRRTACPSMVSM
jgi:Holliday junction resolvasome RuvABC endonuclease subunit